jgi:hypothetical protein
MSFKYKIPLFCFLAITLFSLALLGYTLYITLGTKWALTSLSVTVSSVTINESTPTVGNTTIGINLVIRNPSNMHLAIFYLRADTNFNGTNIWPHGEVSFQDHPLELQTNVETNVMVTIVVDNSTSYSNGIWSLAVRIIFDTSLPKQPSINRELTYGG